MVKILIVEDEDGHRDNMLEAVSKAVSGEGIEITVAHNEDEALALMKKTLMKKEQFDIIITDIRMKAENAGMIVLGAAMQSPSPPAVIMITAYGDVETGPNAMSEGAFDYVEKRMGWTSKLTQVVEEALSEIKKAT